MDLILWRHAEAEDRGKDSPSDAARELTKKGRKQAERVAKWLAPRLPKSARIIVSPAIRTLQTVEPLGRDFETSEEVGLAATARSVLRACEWPRGDGTVVVVGHQPTLGEVAAETLGVRAGKALRKGAAWRFVARDGGEVQLRAEIDAEMLEDD
jgi:phosphohistidine phosphatase